MSALNTDIKQKMSDAGQGIYYYKKYFFSTIYFFHQILVKCFETSGRISVEK